MKKNFNGGVSTSVWGANFDWNVSVFKNGTFLGQHNLPSKPTNTDLEMIYSVFYEKRARKLRVSTRR